jgi:hypothetical protein
MHKRKGLFCSGRMQKLPKPEDFRIKTVIISGLIEMNNFHIGENKFKIPDSEKHVYH